MTSIRDQVREFHVATNCPTDPDRPTLIPDERVRLRAALLAEEFIETMRSLFGESSSFVSEAQMVLENGIEYADTHVDLVELADGLADLDYVVEGTRLEFGIDGAPIAAEVHRSNMAKVGGPVASNGKRLKPAGWTPPDIEGELRRQGMR